MKASLWQDSWDYSRAPSGCAMSLWPVTLADMHYPAAHSEGSLPVCAQPGGIGAANSSLLKPPLNSLYPLRAPRKEELISLGEHTAQHLPEVQWLIQGEQRAGTHTDAQSWMCCVLVCSHRAFNSSSSHLLGRVVVSHRKIAQMDPPKWNAAVSSREPAHRQHPWPVRWWVQVSLKSGDPGI